MKAKILALAFVGFLSLAATSQAGRCGWGGGGGGCYRGPNVAVGWGWGGGCGWRGGAAWRGGWWGPRIGVGVVAPGPVYRRAYVAPAAYVVVPGGSILAVAQQRLARLGYYRGSIDGDFGPQTSNALQTYQNDYGLPVTGRLDLQTRASLGV